MLEPRHGAGMRLVRPIPDDRPPPPGSWIQGLLEYADCDAGANGGFAPCASPPTNRFLNSGGFAGRAGALRAAVAAVTALPAHRRRNIFGMDDDQVAFTRFWLAGSDGGGGSRDAPSRAGSSSQALAPAAALDYGGRLFLTLPRLRTAAVRLAEDGSGRLVGAWRPAVPLCFLHPAGNKLPSFARKQRGFNYSILGLY